MADRRKEARELVEALAPELRCKQPYRDLAIHTYERVGDLPSALTLLDEQLAREPNDLCTRIAWVELLSRTDSAALAMTWLRECPIDVHGSPIELMMLAQQMDQQIGDPKCLHLGYRALRAAYGIPKMHTAYCFGLFIMGKAAQSLRPVITVEIGSAVRLEAEGRTPLIRIIATEADRRIEWGEIAPNDALARRLIGKRIGDVVAIPVQGGPARDHKITEIQSKLVHAHFRSLAAFHDLFPENVAFRTLTFDPTKTHETIAEIAQVSKERAEAMSQVDEAYQNGSLPIALLSKFAGKDPCELLDEILENPNLGFVCATGLTDELEAAERLAVSADLFVLDPLLVYEACLLGIQKQMKACLPRRAVTQSTIDHMRNLVSERGVRTPEQTGTIGWTERGLIFVEKTDETRARALSVANDALAFALDCELVLAEAPTPPSKQAEQLLRSLPEAVSDTILAAQATGRVLVSDDLCLRVLAQACGGEPSIWSQAVLRVGHSQGLIDLSSYLSSMDALTQAGLKQMPLGQLELVASLRKAGWHPTGMALRYLTKFCGSGIAVPEFKRAAVLLLLTAIEDGWDAAVRASATLANTLQREQGQPGKVLMSDVLAATGRSLRHRVRLRNRGPWFRHTGLVNVATVQALVDRPANRLLADLVRASHPT